MDDGHFHARQLDQRRRHRRVHEHPPQGGDRLHLRPLAGERHLEDVAHLGTRKHVYFGGYFINHLQDNASKS